MTVTRLLAITPLILLPLSSQAADKTYVDSREAFSIRLPAEWTSSAEDLDQTLRLTTLLPPSAPATSLRVLTLYARQPLDAKSLHEIAEALLKTATIALQQDAAITSQRRTTTKFNGKDAIRLDFTSRDAQGATFHGSMIVTLGKMHALLIMSIVPSDNADARTIVDAAVASLTLEPELPHTAPASASRPDTTTRPGSTTRPTTPSGRT